MTTHMQRVLADRDAKCEESCARGYLSCAVHGCAIAKERANVAARKAKRKRKAVSSQETPS